EPGYVDGHVVALRSGLAPERPPATPGHDGEGVARRGGEGFGQLFAAGRPDCSTRCHAGDGEARRVERRAARDRHIHGPSMSPGPTRMPPSWAGPVARGSGWPASRPPPSPGRIFPGFNVPSGSNAARSRSIVARSSGAKSSSILGRFSIPTPCPPEIVP